MADYVAGDAAAFETIFHRYHGPVRGYLRRGYLSESDIQDLCQQVFLQLHRARKDYSPDRPLRPWLMTIARNVKRDFFRRELRRRESRFPDPGAGGGDPRFEDLERREALEAALARLPESLGRVVKAYWFEHRSYDEISRRFRISRSAAKVRVHRAYRAMRRLLEDSGYEGCSR
jgi:RNA polymerase sigma-70 factor (ECF subfamily)